MHRRRRPTRRALSSCRRVRAARARRHGRSRSPPGRRCRASAALPTSPVLRSGHLKFSERMPVSRSPHYASVDVSTCVMPRHQSRQRRCTPSSTRPPNDQRKDPLVRRCRPRHRASPTPPPRRYSPAMPTAHEFYARNGARDPERAGFRVSGRCRRRVVGGRRSCVWVFYRRAKRRQAPWWEIKIPGTRGLFICSVRDLPWADPPLPGTKRPKGRAGDHREAGHFPDLGLL